MEQAADSFRNAVVRILPLDIGNYNSHKIIGITARGSGLSQTSVFQNAFECHPPAELAQLVEHLICNQRVGRSIRPFGI